MPAAGKKYAQIYYLVTKKLPVTVGSRGCGHHGTEKFRLCTGIFSSETGRLNGCGWLRLIIKNCKMYGRKTSWITFSYQKGIGRQKFILLMTTTES